MQIKENEPAKSFTESVAQKKEPEKVDTPSVGFSKTAEQKKIESGRQQFQQNSAEYLKNKLNTTLKNGVGLAEIAPVIDSWEYRNEKGASSSDDNYCLTCPITLGVNSPDGNYFSNGIEMKANIKGHKEGYTYDIKRVFDRVFWEKVPKDRDFKWVQTGDDANVSDDKTNNDEYLQPQTENPDSDKINSDKIYYIYSKDRPGLGKRHPQTKDNATEVVFISNFVESVEITNLELGTGNTDPKSFDWHCLIYLKKNETGWEMDEAKSSIGPEHVSLSEPAE